MRERGQSAGFTVIEVAVATAIVAAGVLLAFSSFRQWTRDQHSTEMAHDFAELLMAARGHAFAKGETVVAFFDTDRDGQPLIGSDNEAVAALTIRDLNGDGRIDPGERLADVPYAPAGSLSWGHSQATLRARGDPRGSAGGPPEAAVTFQKPDGSIANWVAFGLDGNPRAYLDHSKAGTGAAGSGGGAIYLTSGGSDYAVVLSALGKVYIREWDGSDESWSR
jgi:Tfp pilus assembly protein FimT